MGISEPWTDDDWESLSRRQQNLEMYNILEQTILTTTRSVGAARAQMEEYVRRLENIENSMSSSGMGLHDYYKLAF